MGHIHSVTDSDTHFIIDPITRQLKNETCKKLTLMQGDHNSERFTFELPRTIEGHDMSTCNKVEVHYININAETKQRSEGVYEVEDFGVNANDESICVCSWLVSGEATKYSGFLNFVVRFVCENDGTVDYVWNTAIYSGITISDGVYNGNAVVTQYADILAQWWKKLLLANGGNIDENSGEQVKIWVGTMAEYEALDGEIEENCLYIITDEENSISDALEAIEKLDERVSAVENKTDLIGTSWITEPSSSTYVQGHIIDEAGLYQVQLPYRGIFGYFTRTIGGDFSIGMELGLGDDQNLVLDEYILHIETVSGEGAVAYVENICTAITVSDGVFSKSITSTYNVPFYIRRVN